MADSKQIDDGGSAFPVPEENYLSNGTYANAGMSKREWFASQAMPQLLYNEGDRVPFCDVADMAVQMADALIAALKADCDA